MSEITKLARDLRNNQTYAEKLLWSEIKNRKLGFKFRRQHPLSCSCNGESHFFISDFACLEKKIIIEIDGKVHNNQQERDTVREFIINELNFKVIRFTNDTVFQNMKYVIETIKMEI